MALVLIVITGIFYILPRPVFSELERRDLTEFPSLPSWQSDSIQNGLYTKTIAQWFSDTEPFREQLLQWSMFIDKHAGLRIGSAEEGITFHAADNKSNEGEDLEELGMTNDREIAEYQNMQNADEAAKIAGAGIIICGKPGEVRAMSAYHGKDGGKRYVTEILVDEMEFLDSKKDSSDSKNGQFGQFGQAVPDSEIPF
jgi:hypothetical protein